jgi:hypothetical protein
MNHGVTRMPSRSPLASPPAGYGPNATASTRKPGCTTGMPSIVVAATVV